MPKVSKQVPTGNHVESRLLGAGVLADIIPVSSTDVEFIKIVIYGMNRVGKTTLACQFPKPLLLVSFEPGQSGGSQSVKKVPGVDFVQVRDSNHARTLADALRGVTKYKTHVLDTVTSAQDMVLRELMNLPDVPVQLNWGTVSRDLYRERSEKTREVLRPFRDLPCHIVFVAQERDHNPPQDNKSALTRGPQAESFFAADLGGATVKWLHDACDYIGRLYVDKERVVRRTDPVILNGKEVAPAGEIEVETGRLVRRLRTMYHPNYAAGFRSSTPEAVPEFLEDPTPKGLYDKVMQVIRGEYQVASKK